MSFLAVTSTKILDRSPLRYPAVQHASSFDPVTMVTDAENAIAIFEKFLLSVGWYTACNKALAQF